MILPALKFVVFSLALFLLLLWSTSRDLWGKISSSARLVGSNPASLWDLPSSLLFSGEAVVKSLTCDNLDLDIVELAMPSSKEAVPLTPSLPTMVQKNVVPPGPSKVSSPAPTRTPWLLTGLVLMGLNAYFPQLSPVSSLWSPLQASVPVAHWMASWWFVAPGWEPNLVSLAPSLTQGISTKHLFISNHKSNIMESVNFTSAMKPFSSLGASTKRERIAMLKKAFLFISGGNLNSFINHFLTQTEFGKTEFIPLIQNQKLNGIIDNLKDLLKSAPQKHLTALRSLVTSSYSLKELTDMGFNITKSEFEYSRKINKNKNVSLNKKSQKDNNYSLKKEIIKK
ncbi:hypothetical protein DSO57_1034866 [Entomophthora muscae]|uniref:Uncharacterized protein n=1 Tax=Entomophthora muscae TaxID=34485 RepID=A0ACC2U971_9FUNG|nr:hypothetical protein DSO57_1034866 [Entomophthora muscae]